MCSQNKYTFVLCHIICDFWPNLSTFQPLMNKKSIKLVINQIKVTKKNVFLYYNYCDKYLKLRFRIKLMSSDLL